MGIALIILAGVAAIIANVAGVVLPEAVTTVAGAAILAVTAWIILRADDADALDGADAE